MNLLNNNIVKGNKYNLSDPLSSNLVVILCTENSDGKIEGLVQYQTELF
ncbi:MAG TPA: hypothetical protein VHJ38_03605 [Nitrososphaeraceae archaeon]|jgi:hypothetical protein|nr:hypothetical protein [Nitrososphaeraceae archaeon]